MLRPNLFSKDQSPIQLDQDTRILYERAVADPASITDEERRAINNLPSAEDEDRFVRETCGLSMTELLAEAVAPGAAEKLSFPETQIIFSSHVIDGPMEMLDRRFRMSPQDRELWDEASKAIKCEQQLVAERNAAAAYRRWTAARNQARDAIPRNEYNLMNLAMRVPWQQRALDMGGASSIGLVLFFPDRPAWLSYKAEIERCVQQNLTVLCAKVHPAIQRRFSLHCIQDGGVSGANLQAQFRALPAIAPGIRSDCFLYVDDDALRSKDTPRPFVWLHEPDTSLDPLKIDIRHICPALFARLTQRDFPAEEVREQPFKTDPGFEGLHLAASRAEAGDDIWPPSYFRA